MTAQNEPIAPASDAEVALRPRVIKLLGKDRSADVPLTYPLQVDDQVIDKITVRRLSTAEVAEFIDGVVAASTVGATKMLRFPMFYDAEGNRLGDDIIDALDDDDAVRLTEAAASFLPQRFRVNEEPDTTPGSGGPIEPS
jgi:hypothetical protein